MPPPPEEDCEAPSHEGDDEDDSYDAIGFDEVHSSPAAPGGVREESNGLGGVGRTSPDKSRSADLRGHGHRQGHTLEHDYGREGNREGRGNIDKKVASPASPGKPPSAVLLDIDLGDGSKGTINVTTSSNPIVRQCHLC